MSGAILTTSKAHCKLCRADIGCHSGSTDWWVLKRNGYPGTRVYVSVPVGYLGFQVPVPESPSTSTDTYCKFGGLTVYWSFSACSTHSFVQFRLFWVLLFTVNYSPYRKACCRSSYGFYGSSVPNDCREHLKLPLRWCVQKTTATNRVARSWHRNNTNCQHSDCSKSNSCPQRLVYCTILFTRVMCGERHRLSLVWLSFDAGVQ